MEREGSEVIRILLVDDVEKIRESLRAILATSPHFEIVGEACDGEEAVLAVAQLKPAVVVMDIKCLGSMGLKRPPGSEERILMW